MQNKKPRRRTFQGALCSEKAYNKRHWRKYRQPDLGFNLSARHQPPEPPKPEEPTPPEKQVFTSITFQEPLNENKLNRLRTFMECTIYLLHERGIIALMSIQKGTIHTFGGPDLLVEDLQTYIGLHFCPFILTSEESVTLER